MQVTSGKSCVIILYCSLAHAIDPTYCLPALSRGMSCILLSAQASDRAPGSKPKLLLYSVPKAN